MENTEKLSGLPGMVIFILDPVRATLKQSLRRDDVPQDLQDQIADICQRVTLIIDQAIEAQKEIDPDYFSQ